jgi:hypothetical protein
MQTPNQSINWSLQPHRMPDMLCVPAWQHGSAFHQDVRQHSQTSVVPSKPSAVHVYPLGTPDTLICGSQ